MTTGLIPLTADLCLQCNIKIKGADSTGFAPFLYEKTALRNSDGGFGFIVFYPYPEWISELRV